jgi:hypothetical protein
MSAMWDTFGYRGTARGQRGYYPCKDMKVAPRLNRRFSVNMSLPTRNHLITR